jgi:hypothetical protein
MFGMKKGVSVSPKNTRADDKQHLISIGYLEEMNGVYKLTPEAKAFLVRLDNYFIKAKKKTDIQLMGKDFVDKINKYRETFPAKKLPSGKPARNNVKALGEAFRWFFETYDYSWDEIHKATSMYVNEYRDKDYLYMQTSQYFISKQDKHKVKHSTLADYCDMILEGVSTEEDHFKENVV